MATAIMSDDAKAAVQEEQHLRIPVVGRQRPTMAEDDGLSRTPVFVEYVGAVFRGDRGHREPPASLNCVDRAKNRTKGSAGASVLCSLPRNACTMGASDPVLQNREGWRIDDDHVGAV